MTKKRNYDDFIDFAQHNKRLTRTEVYWKYREQGGKIKKQTALDLMRDLTKVKKQQQRNVPVKELIKQKKARQKVTVSENDFKSLESPIIQKLYNNIQELYKIEDQTKFLKVGVKNIYDEYSNIKDFNIFIPTEKDKLTVRQLSNEIIKNMTTYYKNLAKKYNTKTTAAKGTLSILSTVKQEIKFTKDITQEEMESIFYSYGIEITGYEKFEFI